MRVRDSTVKQARSIVTCYCHPFVALAPKSLSPGASTDGRSAKLFSQGASVNIMRCCLPTQRHLISIIFEICSRSHDPTPVSCSIHSSVHDGASVALRNEQEETALLCHAAEQRRPLRARTAALCATVVLVCSSEVVDQNRNVVHPLHRFAVAGCTLLSLMPALSAWLALSFCYLCCCLRFACKDAHSNPTPTKLLGGVSTVINVLHSLYLTVAAGPRR